MLGGFWEKQPIRNLAEDRPREQTSLEQWWRLRNWKVEVLANLLRFFVKADLCKEVHSGTREKVQESD